MKKILTVCVALTMLSCSAFSAEINDVSIIEKEVFGIEYNDNKMSDRLERLEKHLFGEVKKGADADRIKNLSEVSGISLLPKPTKEQQRIAEADSEPEDTTVSYPVIDMLEQSAFQKNFQGENVYKRIERLEKKAFGKTFDGDLSERTDKLKASLLALKPEKITYDQNYCPNNYNSYSKKTYFPQDDEDDKYSFSVPMLSKKSQNSFATGMAAPLNQSYYNTYGNQPSDFEFALSAAESMILGKTNKQETPHERLSKLEKKIFKKTYSGDHLSRLDRIVSAAHAQKTGQVYKENKWDRYISTGIQVGTIVLMILAMIL